MLLRISSRTSCEAFLPTLMVPFAHAHMSCKLRTITLSPLAELLQAITDDYYCQSDDMSEPTRKANINTIKSFAFHISGNYKYVDGHHPVNPTTSFCVTPPAHPNPLSPSLSPPLGPGAKHLVLELNF